VSLDHHDSVLWQQVPERARNSSRHQQCTPSGASQQISGDLSEPALEVAGAYLSKIAFHERSWTITFTAVGPPSQLLQVASSIHDTSSMGGPSGAAGA
jgi:hypothetical protein